MLKTLFFTSTLGLTALGAVVIDATTAFGAGEMVTLIVAAVWISRKIQSLEDKTEGLGSVHKFVAVSDEKFNTLDSFIEESRAWRKTVVDEQNTARERQEQILRHQEQARQRNERIWAQLEAAEGREKLYGEVLKGIEELKSAIKEHK